MVVGVTLLALAVGGCTARYVPISNHGTLYLVIAVPYLMLAAPLAMLVLYWGRRWFMAGIAGLLTVVLIAIQVPWFIAATPNLASVPLRTMTINMLYGKAVGSDVVRVASENADVLLAQELTPAAARQLSEAGIEKVFPYQALDARPSSAGVGIYSRYPIAEPTRVAGYQLAMVSGRVRIPEVVDPVSILSVHLDAPWPRPIQGWQGDIAKFPDTLSDVSSKTGDGTVIVGGDFNSTIDMAQFRALLTNGYEDAALQSGSGRVFTYPANKRYLPFLGIDHFLTRNATAIAMNTVEISGTDHRALLATVMVPTG